MARDGAAQPLLEAVRAAEDIGIDIKRGASCSLAAGTQAVSGAESRKTRNKLIFALIICFFFMIVEVAGGILANSLAVMTDAAHLLSDVSGFGVALFATYVAAQSSISTHTFGYHRIEVLGALISVLSTWLVTGILIWEAIDRVMHPVPVNGKLMFLLALVGVAVNLLNFFVLGHSHAHGGEGGCSHSHAHAREDHAHAHAHDSGHAHEHGHSHGEEGGGGGGRNINLQGAVLHVIGDLVQSLGVAVAGALIWWKQDDPRWAIADPICTFLFAFLVLLTTRAILRDISDILMERVPRAHDIASIQVGLEQLEGVEAVHDLHVWALTPGIPLLAVHLNLTPAASARDVVEAANAFCRRLGITHTTVQTIADGQACCGQSITNGAASAVAPPSEAGHGHSHNHGTSHEHGHAH